MVGRCSVFVLLKCIVFSMLLVSWLCNVYGSLLFVVVLGRFYVCCVVVKVDIDMGMLSMVLLNCGMVFVWLLILFVNGVLFRLSVIEILL